VSKPCAFEHVKALTRKGFIEHTANVARGMRLVGRCPCCGQMVQLAKKGAK
jgi:hypothetical protein